MSPRRRPKLHVTLATLAIVAILTALLVLAAGAPPVLAWLAAATLTTFACYGLDKLAARRGWSRIPELSLHVLAVGGGSLGALAGMKAFRHKTIKGSFRLVFFAILAAQIALALWLLGR